MSRQIGLERDQKTDNISSVCLNRNLLPLLPCHKKSRLNRCFPSNPGPKTSLIEVGGN
jgi:hypothetical protein